MLKCPGCETDLRILDIPKEAGIAVSAVCDTCNEFVQYPHGRGQAIMLGKFFRRLSMGDERAKSAVSTPTPTTLHSFLEVLESFDRTYHYEQMAMHGSLRTLLAQIENRLDIAMRRFVKLEFVDDDVVQGMKALREARELVSTMPSRNRGVPDSGGT